MELKRTTTEKSWFIQWVEQYTQFIDRDNWYTYHVLSIEFENDKTMGGYEFTFIFLGLGFVWRWNHTETTTMKQCKDAIKDIRAGTAKLEPFEKGAG